MTIGSLFTGYGGLDLAVEQALGERTVWTCDNDPGAAAVIAERFPKAPALPAVVQTWQASEGR
jgi:DNA (cytosine-5)-methyltransferase 1